jgi:hypothetical protein
MLLAQVVDPPVLHEYISTEERSVAFEALVQLKDLTAQQRFVMLESAKNAVQYTARYSKNDLLNLLSPGTGFRVQLGGSILRIGFTMPPQKLNSGLSILQSVLTEPSFIRESFKPYAKPVADPWASAYQLEPLEPCKFEPDYVRSLWSSYVNADSVQIGVRGNFAPGEVKRQWASYTEGWQKSRTRTFPKLQSEQKGLGTTSEVQLLVFESPRLSLKKQEFAEVLLAVTALGTGKSCVLWDICRERLRMSYRQEAFLLSDRDGWRFRIAIASESAYLGATKTEALCAELSKAIDQLRESDLVRAKGAARGYLLNQIPTLPLIVGVGGVLRQTSEDQLYLNMLWRIKSGESWDPQTMFDAMQAIDLMTLKSRLKALLDVSSPRVIQPN